MQVSQFEIHRLVQRALEGLGAGYGADRDGGRAVAWLEAHGLPGLAALGADLPDLERGIRPPRLEYDGAGDPALEAGGASAITFASAAIDLALARAAASGRSRLRLRRCRSPLYLIPAALEGASGAAIALDWPAVIVRIEGEGALTLMSAPGLDLPAGLLDRAPCDIEIHVAPKGPDLPKTRGDLSEILGQDELARRLAQSLDHGITVDPALWRRIDAVAARVQVPASEESRRKGAGGGDANA